MNKLKSHNSATIDEVLATTIVPDKIVERSLEDKNADRQVQSGRPAQHKSPTVGKQITTDQLTEYLHGVATASIGEIDSLMNDLRGLQVDLAAHRVRVEQGAKQFLELNQSVLALTDIIAKGVSDTKSEQPGELGHGNPGEA
jgi:hypothetical protein